METAPYRILNLGKSRTVPNLLVEQVGGQIGDDSGLANFLIYRIISLIGE